MTTKETISLTKVTQL